MAAILKITDGTTTVNLLSPETEPGFHLNSWRPTIPFYKGGGTFQESSLSWGRTLIDKQFENVIDTFNMKVNDANQDGLIQVMQELRRLLEKASSYWVTDWQDEPVWIEAKATQETNTRYALIVTGRIPQDENPYSQPFNQPYCAAVMNNLDLVIEHLPWQDGIPGAGTNMAIGQSSTFNGTTFGNVNSLEVLTPTTNDEVYRANYRNEANITHIFIDDGGVFSGNQLGAAVPFNLLPAAPAANDALYIGCDSSIADSGPMFNIIFDIGTAGAGYSGRWECSVAAGWLPLAAVNGFRDNTSQMKTTGVNGILSTASAMPAHTTRLVNGVTAYWIRYLVQAAPGPLTAPTQQNRNPYVINWPYIEVQADDIPGEMETLIKTQFRERNEMPTHEELETRFLVLGTRSVSRGDNFSAYINFADEQNPSNIAIATAGGSAFVTVVASPTGRVIRYTSGGATAFTTVATITISSPLTQEYYGKYRMYVRQNLSLSGVSLRAIITSSTGGQQVTSEAETVAPPAILYVPFPQVYVDLGTVVLEGTSKLSTSDSIDNITISIQVATTVARSVELIDAIFIPVDELAIQVFVEPDVNGLEQGEQVIIDSVDYPKYPIRTYKQVVSTSLVAGFWENVAPNRNVIQANNQQRIWMFNGMIESTTRALLCMFEGVQRVVITKQQRYLSMRGQQ